MWLLRRFFTRKNYCLVQPKICKVFHHILLFGKVQYCLNHIFTIIKSNQTLPSAKVFPARVSPRQICGLDLHIKIDKMGVFVGPPSDHLARENDEKQMDLGIDLASENPPSTSLPPGIWGANRSNQRSLGNTCNE
jgi:hypothetical protein